MRRTSGRAVASTSAPLDRAAEDDANEIEASAEQEQAPVQRTSRAPRTLAERLAAARSQQSTETSSSNATSHRSNALRAAESEADAPPTVAQIDERTRDRDGSITKKQTVANPYTESRRAPRTDSATSDETVAHEPVHRMARVDKKPPQTDLDAGKDATARATAAPVATTGAAEDALLFKRQSPLLGVETTGPRTIKIETPAPYKITMQNSGDVAAKEVVVCVKVPEWAEISAAEPEVGTTRSVMIDGNPCLQWMIPTLDPKGRAEMALSVVPHKSRPFDLAVQYTHTPATSQAMVEVQEPKLLMNLAGPDEVYFGEREVYKLTLSNPGTGDAENVVVRLLPTSAGDEQAVSHPIGNIGAGESKVVELELTARQTNTLEIKAEADADGGLHASIDEIIVVRKAELQVAVQGPKMQYAGTPATFRVQVHNPGNATAKNVQVNALLPRGATYLSSSDGGSIDADQRKVSWTVGNLRAETDTIVAFKCLLNTPGANTAQVACHAEGEIRTQGARQPTSRHWRISCWTRLTRKDRFRSAKRSPTKYISATAEPRVPKT